MRSTVEERTGLLGSGSTAAQSTDHDQLVFGLATEPSIGLDLLVSGSSDEDGADRNRFVSGSAVGAHMRYPLLPGEHLSLQRCCRMIFAPSVINCFFLLF